MDKSHSDTPVEICFATSDDDKDASAITHSDAAVAAVPAEHPRSVSSVMLARERKGSPFPQQQNSTEARFLALLTVVV